MRAKKGFTKTRFIWLLILPFIIFTGVHCFSFYPNSEKYQPVINKAAVKYGLPPELIHSIIRAESNFNPRAVSSKGAAGLMQLMPSTAEQYGVSNIFDPEENIEGGTKYLRDLVRLYQKNLDLVLAAYNAGQEAVKKYGGIPPYQETLEYIEKVKSSYGKESIIEKTKIYKYYDDEGRIVITNNVFLYLKHRRKSS